MKHTPLSIPIAQRLDALSDPLRLRLCRILELEELSVGEIAQVVQSAQSTVSRHLKHLHAAGWLVKRSEGTASLYRLTLDDLADDARALWQAVRDHSTSDATAEEDGRRLRLVVAARRTDTAAFFGRLAGDWDALRHDLFGDRFTAHALLAFLPRHWVLADFGSGTGNVAEHLARYVREVVCIDQSEPMLDAAQKRLDDYDNIRFVTADADGVPMDDDAADAATAFLVLHHVAEPRRVLNEMVRVVKPGGPVLVVDMYEHDRAEYPRLMGHEHLGFAPGEAADMLVGVGLEDVACTPLPTTPEAKGPGLFVAVGRVPVAAR
jgi:SAM-dependent methyltransferase